MRLEKLLEKITTLGESEALVDDLHAYSYLELETRRRRWLEDLQSIGIRQGQVVGVQGDYSLDSISLLLAIWSIRACAALLPREGRNEQALLREANAGTCCRALEDGSWQWEGRPRNPEHPLLMTLKEGNRAGVILFSSGTSGKPKAVLHDVDNLLRKYEAADKRFRTLAFLTFDHIAGLDTWLYVVNSGGVLAIPAQRNPHTICKLIQRRRVEVLPTSPTFLSLLCMSGEYDNWDLSSLRIITYGSEPMNPATLERLRAIFPTTKLIQKYGTSEFGSPRSKSKEGDSLWIQIDQDQAETRIVDNTLWVKASTAMLGYLNAPNPFRDGVWYPTGDKVEVDGEWMRIVGRESETIIVGGEKVLPSEVEAVIMELQGVTDVIVKGEPNPIMGEVVVAKIQVPQGEDEKGALKEIRKHCAKRLDRYKVPVRIETTHLPLGGSRHKKVRRGDNAFV